MQYQRGITAICVRLSKTSAGHLPVNFDCKNVRHRNSKPDSMVTNHTISPAPPRVCLDQDGSFERVAEAGVPIKMSTMVIPAENKVEIEFIDDETMRISEFTPDQNDVYLNSKQAAILGDAIIKWLHNRTEAAE